MSQEKTPAGRRSIGPKKRFEVFKRDRFKCVYCGAATPSVVLEVDHVIPIAEGGSNDISNLVTACKPCNQGKGARPLASSVPGIADRIAEEKELAAQMRALKRSLVQKAERDKEVVRIVSSALLGPEDRRVYVDQAAKSILTFVGRLGLDRVVELAEMTFSRSWKFADLDSRFRYFCGSCWRVIKEGELA